jgi:hypothetical protein
MLIAVLLIALRWHIQSGDAELRIGRPFAAWIVLGAAGGLAMGAADLARPFSAAENAAQQIQRLGLQDEHWVTFRANAAQGVSGLSGIRFERPGARCMQTFVRWNYLDFRSEQSMLRWVRDEALKRGRFYVLSSERLSDPAQLRPLYDAGPQLDGWDLYLYAVNPTAARFQANLPDCVENQRPLR